VAHVEAGLRSFDRTMPDELNRMLTDTISTELFLTHQSGVENLCREGQPDERVHFVGNVMIDALLAFRPAWEERAKIIRPRLGLEPSQPYGGLLPVVFPEPLSLGPRVAGNDLESIDIVLSHRGRTSTDLDPAWIWRALL
jgi:hypothetical protein